MSWARTLIGTPAEILAAAADGTDGVAAWLRASDAATAPGEEASDDVRAAHERIVAAHESQVTGALAALAAVLGAADERTAHEVRLSGNASADGRGGHVTVSYAVV